MQANVGPIDPRDPLAEPEGFEAFYLREYHAVVQLAYALSGSRLAAEDIAQEAFLRAFRDWEATAPLVLGPQGGGPPGHPDRAPAAP